MWTPDCSEAIKSKALSALKRHLNEENFITFRRARTKTTFALKEEKSHLQLQTELVLKQFEGKIRPNKEKIDH